MRVISIIDRQYRSAMGNIDHRGRYYPSEQHQKFPKNVRLYQLFKRLSFRHRLLHYKLNIIHVKKQKILQK